MTDLIVVPQAAHWQRLKRLVVDSVSSPITRRVQEARYEGDPWEEVIGPWLESRQSTAISEVLQRCIDKPQAQWTQTDKIRAARCLRAQGWVRYRERQGNRLEWRYRKVV
jgi:hypothetical protein